MNRLLIVLGLAALTAACTKTPPAPPPAAAAPLPSPATATGNAVAAAEPQNSEYIATNKADPNCKGCTGPDATAAPPYHGKPEVALDPKTLAEVQASIDANNALLEQGIDILEKNAKTPDKALAALEKFLDAKKADIDAAQAKANEIRVRLRAVGYDQDIPAEIRPDFEKRMGAISERLERLREVYAQKREVLAAFGRLFPRAR